MKKLHLMDKQNKNIYFMDNASVHRSKIFKEYYNEFKLNIVYNAPYLSKFNPIENVFSLLRKYIQKGINNTKDDIIIIINNFRKNINSTHLTNIFNHCFTLLENCVNNL